MVLRSRRHGIECRIPTRWIQVLTVNGHVTPPTRLNALNRPIQSKVIDRVRTRVMDAFCRTLNYKQTCAVQSSYPQMPKGNAAYRDLIRERNGRASAYVRSKSSAAEHHVRFTRKKRHVFCVSRRP